MERTLRIRDHQHHSHRLVNMANCGGRESGRFLSLLQQHRKGLKLLFPYLEYPDFATITSELLKEIVTGGNSARPMKAHFKPADSCTRFHTRGRNHNAEGFGVPGDTYDSLLGRYCDARQGELDRPLRALMLVSLSTASHTL
jgi:hypothetical protein